MFHLGVGFTQCGGTPTAPVNTVAPAILTADISPLGGDVYAVEATYSGLVTSWSIQWIDNGVNISGETSEALDASALSLTGPLTVSLVAHGPGGDSATFVTAAYVLPTAPSIVSSAEGGTNTGVATYAVPYSAASAGQAIFQFVSTDYGSGRAHVPPTIGPNGETIHSIVADLAATGTADTVNLSVIYWIASATTSAGTLNWSVSTSTEQFKTACEVISGFDSADVIEDWATVVSTNGTEASVTDPIPLPELYVTKDRTLILAALATNLDDVNTIPTGWTKLTGSDIGALGLIVARRDAVASAGDLVAASNWQVSEGPRYHAGVIIGINGYLGGA